MKTVKTPCIGVCSTGIGDSICRGCKRFTDEVINWNGYRESEKAAVLARIDSLTQQVVGHRVEVFDADKLKAQLDLQGVRYDASLSVYSWVYELLRAGAGQIDSLDSFGCRLALAAQGKTLPEIKESIEENLYTLSTVHFERYFRTPVAKSQSNPAPKRPVAESVTEERPAPLEL